MRLSAARPLAVATRTFVRQSVLRLVFHIGGSNSVEFARRQGLTPTVRRASMNGTMRTRLVGVGEVASITRAIDEVRERLGLGNRVQVALVCTLGAVATTFSLALVMPFAIVAGLLWILWESARWLVGQRRGS